MENIQYKCAIFDLDGVLVDTAKYHYLAWKSLAQELRFVFTLQQNEALKGVSRMKSLELLLEFGGLSGRFSQEEKEQMAEKKNRLYVEKIMCLKKDELFPGVLDFFRHLKEKGIKSPLDQTAKTLPLSWIAWKFLVTLTLLLTAPRYPRQSRIRKCLSEPPKT